MGPAMTQSNNAANLSMFLMYQQRTLLAITMIKLLFILLSLGVAYSVIADESALPVNVEFIGSWDAKSSAWMHEQVWAPGRIKVVNDPVFPKPVGLIEVHPGDDVGGWSGERAEVSGMQDAQGKPLPVTAQSGHEFYGIAVKLPRDWKAPAGTNPWGIFLQLHGPDTYRASPAIALNAENDFHISLCSGDLLEGGKRAKPKGVTSYKFSNGNLNLGHPVEFMLDVVWAADNTGSIIVYRRDEGQTQWDKVFEARNTPTLQYVAGEKIGVHYWKTGYYRNRGNDFTSKLWLSPAVRGLTFEDVAKAAFGRP